jgi:hypothetical protein
VVLWGVFLEFLWISYVQYGSKEVMQNKGIKRVMWAGKGSRVSKLQFLDGGIEKEGKK